ncbi:MAG: hypothetical protein D6725_15280 [Planctomycetota bacterium]|nr:MAG: hypothetical protein D6725_15280 [Planctomycetota bacterium]
MWKAGELPALRRLDLSRNELSDIAYPGIVACFPQLQELSLDRTPITDREFPFLVRLRNLRKLYLAHTSITSAALKAIPDMHSRAAWGVEELDLTGTDIDNEAITGGLSELPRLQSLTLSGTKVDAKGLRTLAEMTQFGYFRQLSYLDVDETQIDAETKKYVEDVIRKHNWDTNFQLRVVPRRKDQ